MIGRGEGCQYQNIFSISAIVHSLSLKMIFRAYVSGAFINNLFSRSILCFHFLQDIFDLAFELWHLVSYNRPNNIPLYTKIKMDDFISHSSNALPVKVFIFLLKIICKV